MKAWIPILCGVVLTACTSKEDETSSKTMPFSTALWSIQNEGSYPHRSGMYQEVLYSDSIRQLRKPAVLSMLGQPDRIKDDHYYYLIDRTMIGGWTLRQRSLVIKFNEDTVAWIKTYE